MRLSNEDDIPELAELIHLFYQETRAPYEWCQDKVEALLRLPLSDPEKAVCFVEEKDGMLVGFLHAIAGEPSMSRTRVCTELGFYILPEYRGRDIAVNLIGGLEYWAREIAKVQYIHLVSLHTMEPYRVDGFYTKCGYHVSEYTYIKEI